MNKVRTIDLFCGAGGFSLGCIQAGLDVVLGVDSWDKALETYELNLPGETLLADITQLTGEELLEITGGEIDVVIGAPPCQGFSIAGRRDPKDARNNLIFEFLRLVIEIHPKYFMMENVPGMLSADKGRVFGTFCKMVDDSEYEWDWMTLNAKDYGVPQNRKRVFFAGWLPEMPKYEFPEPTHCEPELAYEPDLFGREMLPYVNVGEAIGNMPPPINEDSDIFLYKNNYDPGKGWTQCPACGYYNILIRKNCHHCDRINTFLVLPSDI